MIEYEDLIGTSFEDLNCWELVQELYARAGVSLEGYNISVDACEEISKVYARELEQGPDSKWMRLVAPEELCLIPMRVNPKFVSHCGVYVGNGRFIHSLANTGVLTSRVSDPAWRSKITGFYRYVG